nr:tigger transposable element-derived protein 1-like [Caretta caretta]
MRLMFSRIRSTMDADPNLNVMECWKSFNTADCITYIKQAMDAIKPETVNACWQNLWKECVNDFKGFPTIDKEVKRIVQVTRQVGGDSFVDILEEEIEELTESHRETLTNKELEELIKSSTEDEDDDDDDDEQEEPASWNLHKFAEVFQAEKHLNDLISEYDPSMERSLKITRSITDDLRLYQEMFEQLKRQQRQLPITMFFKEKQPAADEPMQSTSRTEPEPTTWSMTRSPSPPSPGLTSSPDDPL